ncbi:hypothetical protein FHG87_002788 [Trinorchestia longiramus]|nr:hypothetical protein FHG87_002788 [Trinorchestia longiramus]
MMRMIMKRMMMMMRKMIADNDYDYDNDDDEDYDDENDDDHEKTVAWNLDLNSTEPNLESWNIGLRSLESELEFCGVLAEDYQERLLVTIKRSRKKPGYEMLPCQKPRDSIASCTKNKARIPCLPAPLRKTMNNSSRLGPLTAEDWCEILLLGESG